VSEIQRSVGELRREEVEVLVVEDGVFEVEESSMTELIVSFDDVEEASEEHVASGDSQLELESSEDGAFHLHDFVAVVSVCSDGDTLSNCGSPHFFVLGSDPDSSDTDELELSASNSADGEIAVDDLDGEEVSFGVELELETDINEPVDEDGAHLFVDFGLRAEIVGVAERLLLAFEENVNDVVAEFGGAEGIDAVLLVNSRRAGINRVGHGDRDEHFSVATSSRGVVGRVASRRASRVGNSILRDRARAVVVSKVIVGSGGGIVCRLVETINIVVVVGTWLVSVDIASAEITSRHDGDL
jgi:hypothetical protein